MKIFFTIKCINYPAGTERATSVIANSLAEKGHEVHIASLIGEGRKPFFNIDDRISIHYLSPVKDRHPKPYSTLAISCPKKGMTCL